MESYIYDDSKPKSSPSKTNLRVRSKVQKSINRLETNHPDTFGQPDAWYRAKSVEAKDPNIYLLRRGLLSLIHDLGNSHNAKQAPEIKDIQAEIISAVKYVDPDYYK